MINVIAYATTVRYLYPSLGLIAGTLGAFAVAGLSASAMYALMPGKKQ